MSLRRYFFSRTLDFIGRYALVSPGDELLAAVSGGPDSVALLHCLHQLRQSLQWKNLVVIHLDHRLRGEASLKDMEFVRSLAGRLDLPFHTAALNVEARRKAGGLSLEMAARECRQRFFQEALERFNADTVAVGHNAEDQAEEILLRLLRGAGPSGLAGMSPKNSGRRLIRPLLWATRQEILGYLDENGLSYCRDLSNEDPFCQRNALRLKVFPILRRHFNPGITSTLCRHGRLAREEEDFWSQEVRARWPAVCLQEAPDRIVLNVPSLEALHPALQKRLLRRALEKLKGGLGGIHEAHIEALQRLVHHSISGKSLHLPKGLRAAKESGSLSLLKAETWNEGFFSRELPAAGRYPFSDFTIHLKLKKASLVKTGELSDPDTACMDAEKLLWPLELRSWKAGDCFQPLGLKGSKKIQDFFVDAKVARSQRRRIPILWDREKICWVAGYRLDERVKLSEQTREALVVRIERGSREEES